MPLSQLPIVLPGRPIIYSIDDAWFHKGIRGIHSLETFIRDENGELPATLQDLQIRLSRLQRHPQYVNGGLASDAICLSIICDHCIRYNFGLVIAGFQYLKEKFLQEIQPRGHNAAVLLDVGLSVAEEEENGKPKRIDDYGAQVLDEILETCISKSQLPLPHIFFFSSRGEDLNKYKRDKLADEDGVDAGVKQWVFSGYRVVEKLAPDAGRINPQFLEDQKEKVETELGYFFKFFNMITRSGPLHERIRATMEEIIQDGSLSEGHIDAVQGNGETKGIDDIKMLPLKREHLVLANSGDISFKALYCFRRIAFNYKAGWHCSTELLQRYLAEAGLTLLVAPGTPQAILLPIRPGCLFLHNLIHFAHSLESLEYIELECDEQASLARLLFCFSNTNEQPAQTLVDALSTGGGHSTECLRGLLSCTPRALVHPSIDTAVEAKYAEWMRLRGEGSRKDILPPVVKYGCKDAKLFLEWNSPDTVT